MTKPITGTFFEFEHPNRSERKYMHEAMCGFSQAQWRENVRETAAMGMDTLILLSTAHRGVAYFPFDGYPYAPYLTCPDVIEVLLDEADHTRQSVFVGVGFYGETMDSVRNSTDPATVKTALRAMERLYALYGHHLSFCGWYIADEWCIWEHFDERFITYINTVTAQARALNPAHKVMLAPFGTHCLKADDTFVSQLERIEADIIAYQDEIGVRKLTLDALPTRFEALCNAHRKAGRAKLWADMEIFDFEGDVYQSALIPAPWERIKAQMESLSPFVEKIIVYTTQSLMHPADTLAPCGIPDLPGNLWAAYRHWNNRHT